MASGAGSEPVATGGGGALTRDGEGSNSMGDIVGSFEPSFHGGLLGAAMLEAHASSRGSGSGGGVGSGASEDGAEDDYRSTPVVLNPGPHASHLGTPGFGERGAGSRYGNMNGSGDGQNGGAPELVASAADPEQQPQRVSTLFRVCPFILGNEFCERLAFYGLSTNLVIYLTTVMGYESSNAAAQVTFFDGTCYLTPLLGAWMADSIWGRYKTILFFSYIYLVGLLMLVVSVAAPGLSPTPGQGTEATAFQSTILFLSLYTIALGTGGIKPNVSAFGADQFDVNDPQDAHDKKSFFNWFYFSINLGSFVAAVVIVYVQESISWAIGFLIPAIAMAIAVTFFQCGSKLYSHILPAESPLSRVVKVVAAAISNRRKSLAEVDQQLQQQRAAAFPRYRSPYSNEAAPVFAPVPQALTAGAEPGAAGLLKRSGSFQWLDKAILTRDGESEGLEQGLLASAVGQFTEKQVHEVKLVLRMLPVFFTTIFYWALYMQMGSLFVQQGASMDRLIFNGAIQVPAASLSTFNTISIIVLVPVYDKLFLPALRACGLRMTMLQRIGWGQLVAILAMLAAAWVENQRLSLAAQGRFVDKHHRVVDMVIWYQTPQYILVGLSEVFTSIGQLEFFYNQAPDVMRSCSMALQLLTSCLGSYSAGVIVWATQAITRGADGTGGWLPKNINNGHLDYYFVMLAGMMTVNTLLYLVVAMNYEYKEVEHEYTVRKAPPPSEEGEEPQPASMASVTQSIAIQGARRGKQPLSTTKEGPYGRSITYVPASPNLPPQLR